MEQTTKQIVPGAKPVKQMLWEAIKRINKLDGELADIAKIVLSTNVGYPNGCNLNTPGKLVECVRHLAMLAEIGEGAVMEWNKPESYIPTPNGETARCVIVCCANGMRHGWWSREPLKEHFVAWSEMPDMPGSHFFGGSNEQVDNCA